MSGQRPILVVDDDNALREALIEQLELDGEFAPQAADCLAAAEAVLAKTTRFDAVLLDVGLPDGDGRDFCRKLRERGIKAPIIMLTRCSPASKAI